MGRVRMTIPTIPAPSQLTRSRLVVVLGGASLVGGLWARFGYELGLVVAGVLAIAYGLLLMDVDGNDDREG